MAYGQTTTRRGAFLRWTLLLVCAGAGISGCASVPATPVGLASPIAKQPWTYPQHSYQAQSQARSQSQSQVRTQAEAQPSKSSMQKRYKIGAPYQAGGVWYVPAEQPGYDEVGLASWYGDAFNGKPTANGELFDMNGVSAAHATLPLPSLLEVTNLENGRTLQVRLNDRGPFHPGRIIDLSRGAAQQLGFYQKGTAKVRVRFVRTAPALGADTNTTIALNPMHSLLPQTPMGFGPSASLGFVVQAGAYSSRTNAERVAVRLASAGRTSIQPVDHNGARLYRVTVGSWTTALEAGTARDRVASLGFAQARIASGS